MNLLTLSDEKIVEIANPILDNIIQATSEKNWLLFTKHLPESMKTDPHREIIEKQWSSTEFPTSFSVEREFLSVLRKSDCVLVLWKMKNNNVKEDLLQMLYLQNQEDEIKVIGTWVK